MQVLVFHRQPLLQVLVVEESPDPSERNEALRAFMVCGLLEPTRKNGTASSRAKRARQHQGGGQGGLTEKFL